VVIVHGEVKPELQQAADEVMSTSQMAKYVENHPEKKAPGHPHRVRPGGAPGAGAPRQAVLQALPPVRAHEGHHLESVYETLRDEPAQCLVTVPEAVRQRAAARHAAHDRPRRMS
jgi:hypothetical protein